MHQPAKWWIGLLPLALIWAASNLIKMDSVEADLTERVKPTVATLPRDVIDKTAVTSAGGRDIMISGTSLNAQAANQADAAADAVFGVRKVAVQLTQAEAPKPPVKVTPPPVVAPYVFNADKTSGSLKLTGTYPDEKTHADILAAARATFSGLTIDDQLKQADGAPDSFLSIIKNSMTTMAQLLPAKLSMSGLNANLTGEAETEKAANNAKAAFAGGLPASFKGESKITFKPAPPPPPPAAPPVVAAPACKSELAATFNKVPVLFPSGSAMLTPEAVTTLSTVASRVKDCTGAGIFVKGYTDSTGNAAFNQQLSKARAQAVVGFLVDHGIDASRITLSSYGQDDPVATNETSAGKAQNRRVEISAT